MNRIPLAPFALGLAGLIPFAFGAVTTLGWLPSVFGMGGPMFTLAYGTIILSFMSGVLWGFATKTTGARAAAGYVLSVLPALWAFFMRGDTLFSATTYQIFGFVGLLLIDFQFSKWDLTPTWWMRLRVILSTIVILSLASLLI
jgi:hypothetical protein